MISFLIGFPGALTALIGWFGFHSVTALIVGTALYIVETTLEWRNLNAGAKAIDVFIFAFGSAIAALFTSAQWYIGGMIARARYSIVIGTIGLITMLKTAF